MYNHGEFTDGDYMSKTLVERIEVDSNLVQLIGSNVTQVTTLPNVTVSPTLQQIGNELDQTILETVGDVNFNFATFYRNRSNV